MRRLTARELHLYGNALAKTVNREYKTEPANRLVPCDRRENLNLKTLEWVHLRDNARVSERNGCKTSAQVEGGYIGMDIRVTSKKAFKTLH
jgi:hypothetical protein